MFNDALDEVRDAISKTTSHQRKVGTYFYEHPETLGVLSLSEFVQRIGTSGPTITRFCQIMGYNGFLEFSKAMRTLRNNEVSHATFFHNARVRNEKIGERGALARVLIEKEQANISKFIENYPDEKIAKCVSLMKNSSSIAVVGDLSTYAAALNFEQLLSKVTSKLMPMSGSAIMQAVSVSRLDKDSVVFFIAFPRYPKSVIELAKDVSQKGATVVAITDSDSSPLAEISDIYFTVDVELFACVDLLGAVFTLINILCMEFALEIGVPSEHSLVKYDRAIAGAVINSINKNKDKNDADLKHGPHDEDAAEVNVADIQ